VFGEIVVIFTVLTIIVGEGFAWRKKHGIRGEESGRVGIEI
jgi:hypothetical protein